MKECTSLAQRQDKNRSPVMESEKERKLRTEKGNKAGEGNSIQWKKIARFSRADWKARSIWV